MAVSRPTPANWASILFLGVIWGGTFMVVSVALRAYGPVTVAAARTTLGAVALLALLPLTGHRLPVPDGRLLRYVAAIGLFSTALPFTLLSWGQQYVPSAFAGISMAALPIFVLPLAHLFADEPLSRRKLAGVALGFIGALVLIGPSALRLGQGMEPLGQIACVGASLSYAVASILTRRCPPVDPLALAALTLGVGAVLLVPAMLATEGWPEWQGGLPSWAILLLGLVPTALAALLRVTIIRSAGSVFMTLVNYQVPVWSTIFGTLVLGEVLPWRFFGALALILCGIAVSQGGRRPALRRPPPPRPRWSPPPGREGPDPRTPP